MKLNEKSTPAEVGSQPYAMKKWPGSLLANDNDRAIVTRNVDAIVMAMIDLTVETDDGFRQQFYSSIVPPEVSASAVAAPVAPAHFCEPNPGTRAAYAPGRLYPRLLSGIPKP